MSARAASRLESLGFRHVYDYVAGMNDWSARRLPIEGHLSHMPKAGDAMDPDVVTCRPDESATTAQQNLARSNQPEILVTNEHGVILGRFRPGTGDIDAAATVGDLMDPGPTTARADEILEDLVPRMRDRHVESMIVTDPDGRLMGVMRLSRAEELLAAPAHTS